MPARPRLLGTEQLPDLSWSQLAARWRPDGRLAALIATAPPAEDAPPVEDAPQMPPPAERTPLDQELPPPDGGVPFVMPAFFLEGWETSDHRLFEAGGWGRRDLPQTLMAMRRNPDGGFGGHDAAIIAGRIDRMERFDAADMINRETGQPFGPGVFAWRSEGWLIGDTEETASTIRYVRDGVLRTVSVDLSEVDADFEVIEEDEDGLPEVVRMRAHSGTIAQITLTPFAAFPSATIELADGTQAEEQEDVPVPVAASAIRIREPARGRQALVASLAADVERIAPLLPPREWFDRVDVPDPSRHIYLGRRPNGVPTGQVWGYLAQWDVPHAGILDREVYAPRLGPAGYRTFASHGSVLTAENEEVSTGIATFGCGHDMDMTHGVIPAIEHYDNAGTAYADIVVGEDDFGPWFAGAMRPHLTRQQIEEFARHPLSGDWRANPGDVNVRLVAALCVNTPGFSIRGRAHITASGVRTILAAGSAPLARRARRAGGADPDEVRRVVDERMRPVLAAAARAGLARVRGT